MSCTTPIDPRAWGPTLCLALSLLAPPWALASEEILLRDGTVVRGSLVGYEDGRYQVQIGKFVKLVPEEDVVEVRGAQVRPPTAPGADKVAPTPAGVTTGVQASGSAGPHPGPVTGDSSGAARTPGPGPQIPTGGSALGDILGQVGFFGGDLGGGGKAPMGEQEAAARAVSQVLGRPYKGDPRDLEALRDNPIVGRLVEQFKDPSFRENILREVEATHERIDPGRPSDVANRLRDLFRQLDAASKPARPRTGGRPPPAPLASPAPGGSP